MKNAETPTTYHVVLYENDVYVEIFNLNAGGELFDYLKEINFSNIIDDEEVINIFEKIISDSEFNEFFRENTACRSN